MSIDFFWRHRIWISVVVILLVLFVGSSLFGWGSGEAMSVVVTPQGTGDVGEIEGEGADGAGASDDVIAFSLPRVMGYEITPTWVFRGCSFEPGENVRPEFELEFSAEPVVVPDPSRTYAIDLSRAKSWFGRIDGNAAPDGEIVQSVWITNTDETPPQVGAIVVNFLENFQDILGTIGVEVPAGPDAAPPPPPTVEDFCVPSALELAGRLMTAEEAVPHDDVLIAGLREQLSFSAEPQTLELSEAPLSFEPSVENLRTFLMPETLADPNDQEELQRQFTMVVAWTETPLPDPPLANETIRGLPYIEGYRATINVCQIECGPFGEVVGAVEVLIPQLAPVSGHPWRTRLFYSNCIQLVYDSLGGLGTVREDSTFWLWSLFGAETECGIPEAP